eukprot:GFUD01026959.1.p1 GENE.GFUD01026959.1~~GFUD01026959.1.p1  ORF type:complete len:871 (+),score=185.18 GFUD01026959.1:91-2703(+)
METTDQNEEDTQHTSSQKDEEDDSSKLKKRPATALTLVCGVCSAPAPDHLHFGAHSCYSCRAFFRRTAQRMIVKSLKRCKTGSKNCEISNQTKNCIHCRYLKCLKIGMTPDLLQGQRKKEVEDKLDEEYEEHTDTDRTDNDKTEDKFRKRQSSVENISSSAKHGKFSSEGAGISENEKARLFLPASTPSYPQNQKKYTSAPPGVDRALPGYEYSQQIRTLQKPAILPFRQAAASPSKALLSSTPSSVPDIFTHYRPHSQPYRPNLPTQGLTTTDHSFNYLPPSTTHSGYSRPTSTITSQMYQLEQEKERKNRMAEFAANGSTVLQNIKKEPNALDDAILEGSLMNDAVVVNPYANIRQINESLHGSFQERLQGREVPQAHNSVRYQESCIKVGKAPNVSRPSVIRSLNNPRDQEQRFLQMESEMLKLHGDLLKQTGNMFNYHANILDQHRLRQTDMTVDPATDRLTNECIKNDSEDMIEQNVKKEHIFTNIENENMTNSTVHMNSIDETEDLLENSPWILAMDKYLDKVSEGNLDDLVDDVLLETLVEVEAGNGKENNETPNYDIDTKYDDLPDDFKDLIAPSTAGHISVIQGPEMVLTTEEIIFLNRNKIIHEGHLRSTCPVSLFQARVAQYLGKISKDGLMHFLAAGRKAQNYYHYMTMASQPFFNELTTRTQTLLMRQNTQLCFSLNIANYFFGHNAKTAIEQEEMPGMVTGLGDYIRANAPEAVNMPLAAYDDYFAGPWATAREHEARHRELTKSIGDSIKDLDFSAYLLLYGITLYNITQQTLLEMNIPEKDIQVIKKAQNYLDLLYKRYTKHLIGWKRASETRLNQRYLLEQMNDCVLIFSMKSLQLNDLTNSETLDPSSVKLS